LLINVAEFCVVSPYVRLLTKCEWQDLRDIRIEALTLHPDMFCASMDYTKSLTKNDWKNYIDNENSKIFGLFDNEKLIGITSIFSTKENPHIAILAMNYIKPNYRGQGLVKLLYQSCIDLALQNNNIEMLQVSHREGNDVSKNIILKYGFKYSGEKEISWTDATQDIEHIYTLDLCMMRNPYRVV